jgi:hypothetical protein
MNALARDVAVLRANRAGDALDGVAHLFGVAPRDPARAFKALPRLIRLIVGQIIISLAA